MNEVKKFCTNGCKCVDYWNKACGDVVTICTKHAAIFDIHHTFY